MREAWINEAIAAAERGDVAELDEVVRDHWTVENVFRLLKTAATRYGLTSAEMADELHERLQRHLAEQTRH